MFTNSCRVHTDTMRHLDRQDEAEAREAKLRRQYPLEDFEEQAVSELLSEGFDNYGGKLISGDAAQQAAYRISLNSVRPDLMPANYATDGLVRDENLLRDFISGTVPEIEERLQDQKINDPWIWNGA